MRLRNFLLFLAAVFLLGAYYYSDAKIYIIRHGEKIITDGVSDAPLTENGKAQAHKLGEFLSHETKSPKLFSSPMRRARETAEIIASQTKSAVSFDDRLTEKNYRKSEHLYPDGKNIYVKFLHNGEKETKEQHLARLMDFLNDTVRLFDKNIFIVGHGGLVQRAFEKIAASTKKNPEKYKIPYCSVFIFQYNKITKSLRYIDNFTANDRQSKSS